MKKLATLIAIPFFIFFGFSSWILAEASLFYPLFGIAGICFLISGIFLLPVFYHYKKAIKGTLIVAVAACALMGIRALEYQKNPWETNQLIKADIGSPIIKWVLLPIAQRFNSDSEYVAQNFIESATIYRLASLQKLDPNKYCLQFKTLLAKGCIEAGILWSQKTPLSPSSLSLFKNSASMVRQNYLPLLKNDEKQSELNLWVSGHVLLLEKILTLNTLNGSPSQRSAFAQSRMLAVQAINDIGLNEIEKKQLRNDPRSKDAFEKLEFSINRFGLASDSPEMQKKRSLTLIKELGLDKPIENYLEQFQKKPTP